MLIVHVSVRGGNFAATVMGRSRFVIAAALWMRFRSVGILSGAVTTTPAVLFLPRGAIGSPFHLGRHSRLLTAAPDRTSHFGLIAADGPRGAS
jgi:hypothetical protein